MNRHSQFQATLTHGQPRYVPAVVVLRGVPGKYAGRRTGRKLAAKREWGMYGFEIEASG